jgi:hypothetical protein
MKPALLTRLVMAALISLLAATSAYAECVILPPFCEAFWSLDAVFDGTVIRSEPIEREAWAIVLKDGRRVEGVQMKPHTLLTLSVNQAWRGVTTTEVQLVVEGASTLTGRWLVVGNTNSDGTVSPMWCGASQKYEEAGEKLAFLRSLEQPAQGGRISGLVAVDDELAPGPGQRSRFVPVVTRVTLKSQEREWATSSSDGKYEFRGLAAGDYTVAIDVPPATKGYRGAVSLKIPNVRACADWSFRLEPSGSIAGEILAADGTPVTTAQVSLVSADRWREPNAPVRTLYPVKGRFELEGVGPGRYVLIAREIDPVRGAVPNSSLAAFLGPGPQWDSTIQVAAGQHVTLPPLTLPLREAEIPIELELQWSDGTPVGRASIRIEEATDVFLPARFRSSYPMITDETSRVRPRLVRGRLYVVSVWSAVGRPGSSATIPITVSESFVAGDPKQLVRLIAPR